MFVSVNELVGLPGMPGSAQGVRYTIKKLASSEHFRRKRAGTKAIEYHIDCLPEATQKALRERYVEQLVATENNVSEVQVVTRKARNPDAVQAIEAYRGSPQLMEERLNALTENQRRVSEARAALVVEVLKLESDGNLGRLKAINYLVEKARKGELPERLQQAAVNANAKRGANRTISRDPLYQWVLKYNQSQNAAERLLLLAPGKRDEIKPEQISWLPEFLAQYRQVNGRPMSEAYEDFVAEWQRRHADEPYMLEVMPSYDVVRYAMKKLPEVVKQKGRVTGSEYRQLEGFTRRDWTAMPVNYVWIGDGHGMKLKCAHPIHGRPFSPEVTFVIDGGTRFVVGWSLDLAENVFAVAGAIQHGIRNHGKPFLYYSDKWIEGLPAELKQLSAPLLFGVSAIGWLTIILVAFMAWLLAKTAFGRSFYATGDNLQGARQLGVRTEAIRIVAFSLNGCMAALAGIVFASQIGFIPNQTGTGLEMKAIAACVLGGISLLGGSGAIIGAVLGAWFLTQIDSVLVLLRIPAWWNDFIAGLVLLAVLVFDGRLRCALERNLRRQKYARFMTPPPSVKPASSGKKREAA